MGTSTAPTTKAASGISSHKPTIGSTENTMGDAINPLRMIPTPAP
jgi:hypothetical protein